MLPRHRLGDVRARKSRALRILAVEGTWFADKLPLDAREILETTEDKWFVEASELRPLNQNNVRMLKACLARQYDEARLACQATVSRVPRQFLIVGTVNVADALRFCETEGYSVLSGSLPDSVSTQRRGNCETGKQLPIFQRSATPVEARL